MTYDHEHQDDILITSGGADEYRPMWVVEGDETLSTKHSGGICVENGASFRITSSGQHSGSLTFRPGSAGTIVGQHSGSLEEHPETDVVVEGAQSGSVHVSAGATLKVAASGRLAGSLHVEGTIENRGQRGGSEHIFGGQVLDIDGGTVKQPALRNGAKYYEW